MKDYANPEPRKKTFSKICYIPCPADLAPPGGVDTIELLEVKISLDFRLPSVNDIFENLFEDQSQTDDLEDSFWSGDFIDDSSVDQSLGISDRATLVRMNVAQNLKLFPLLEASLRVLFLGSLNSDFPGIKIVEKPPSLKDIVPSQFNPRHVRVRASRQCS